MKTNSEETEKEYDTGHLKSVLHFDCRVGYNKDKGSVGYKTHLVVPSPKIIATIFYSKYIAKSIPETNEQLSQPDFQFWSMCF